MRSFPFALLATAVLWLGANMHAVQQTPAAAPSDQQAPARKPDEGIPVTSAVVQKACGACHKSDEKQQMTRISFQRNTPEGWQEVIRRMAALNGLRIDPATAREVVRYLSNNHGLAPEEVRPYAWEVERRIPDFKYTANDDTEEVCKKCHTLGRVLLQRRTRDEWNLLIAMHRGWYPLVDNQAFRRQGPPPRDGSSDGRPPDTRQPVEKVVDHLARTFPLRTPEWTAWSATMRPARLDGTWLLSGYEIGKGPMYGRMRVTSAADSPDEITTDISWVYSATGEQVSRTGRALVYTGYQWRGRSVQGADEESTLQEVMFVDREWRTIDGRWFTGGYDELGMEVKLERLGADPRVLGTDRAALRVGSTAQALKIFGANLPPALQPRDVDLGPGVTVTRVVSVGADEANVIVDVAATAPIGMRDLFVAGSSRPKAIAVYDSVDALKVTPEWAMARVGGIGFPKALAQFEARAFDNGPDDRPDTADDIDLGMVPATWSIEEFMATYDDDDIKFVGEMDSKTGRFTPAIEGPNPARRGARNNIGDVYAVAVYTPPAADKGARPLRARGHLLVTVPLYMRWEPVATPGSRGGPQQ